MVRSREEIRKAHRELKVEYATLFDSVAALLFRHDPIGINFDDNTDEYESEVGTILPRLRTCESPEDVLLVVHQEFVRWFGEATTGSAQRYVTIAAEIWQLWKDDGRAH
jgi:hypothetical protein